MMREITALVAVAAGHLVALADLRFWAIMTRTISLTPAGSSCSVWSSRRYCLTSITYRARHAARRNEVSFTSRAFSPKMARSKRSSALSSVLAARRDLADQDVVRPDLGADADDAVLVQVGQRILADVRICA